MEQKVHIISLGCPKNRVDSEYVVGSLFSSNFDITEKIEDADIAIINTCGFIQDAVRESIDVILEMARFKTEGSLKKLVVMGCMVQRYGYKLMREIPEVDIWVGTGQFFRISDILKKYEKGFFISRPSHIQEQKLPRFQSTPFYTAYVKISDGCSHRCSYCLIPKLRGSTKSVKPDIILNETRELVRNGVKEINIVAQDITAYGKDLYGNMGLEDLIEMLLGIKEIEWIRLLYLHPSGISDRLLKLMEHEDRICPYMDIPIQHVNDHILSLMGRGYNKGFLLDLINRIKALRRRIFLRTSIMVGFPGETGEIFSELCDFIKDTEWDHLGVFVFSPEEGTSAARLKDQMNMKVAKERRDELLSLQAEISRKKNREMVGKTVPVLVEGFHPETEFLLVGRTPGMAPDIDGQVIINKGHGIIGEIMRVRISDSYVYDLMGEIL